MILKFASHRIFYIKFIHHRFYFYTEEDLIERVEMFVTIFLKNKVYDFTRLTCIGSHWLIYIYPWKQKIESKIQKM